MKHTKPYFLLVFLCLFGFLKTYCTKKQPLVNSDPEPIILTENLIDYTKIFSFSCLNKPAQIFNLKQQSFVLLSQVEYCNKEDIALKLEHPYAVLEDQFIEINHNFEIKYEDQIRTATIVRNGHYDPDSNTMFPLLYVTNIELAIPETKGIWVDEKNKKIIVELYSIPIDNFNIKLEFNLPNTQTLAYLADPDYLSQYTVVGAGGNIPDGYLALHLATGQAIKYEVETRYNSNMEADFSSELPKKNDALYIDIDHSKIFINFKPNDKKDIVKYQYRILDHQNQQLFQSSELIFNPLSDKETINLNLKNILKNNIFKRAALKFELKITNKYNQIFTQEQALIYWYVVKSNIPIMRIQVENNVEPPQNKDKKNASYEFYDQAENTTDYFLELSSVKTGSGTVNVRGSSSADFPKKSYTISLDKNTELLGFPAHKKWTVIGGWIDKTHLANYGAYHLYKKLGHYAQGANVVLIYVNEDYRGVYTFLEKIEQGDNRVPTAKKEQGGFILQLENCCIVAGTPVISLSSNVKYTYDYPSSPTLDEQNKISQVMNNYINALKNKQDWRSLYNEEAEIDLFILNEIFANVDGYGNSKNVLYFLDKKTQKIEPIAYDFVASLGVPVFSNINSFWNFIMNSPALIYNSGNFPLLPHYKQDAQFTNNLKNRYKMLRSGILSDAEIFGLLEPLMNKLENGKHYFHDMERWTDLKFQRYSAEEFKAKFRTRLQYVDQQWR